MTTTNQCPNDKPIYAYSLVESFSPHDDPVVSKLLDAKAFLPASAATNATHSFLLFATSTLYKRIMLNVPLCFKLIIRGPSKSRQ